MRVLLDTQLFLWFLADSKRLSHEARASIANADSVHVSAASLWEATIKIGLRKLHAVPGDLVAGIPGSGFSELAVTATHAVRVATLPSIHRDPFDRLLIAQAMSEPLHLLTADSLLTRYSDLVVVV